jgi:hypothetical protein
MRVAFAGVAKSEAVAPEADVDATASAESLKVGMFVIYPKAASAVSPGGA